MTLKLDDQLYCVHETQDFCPRLGSTAQTVSMQIAMLGPQKHKEKEERNVWPEHTSCQECGHGR